MTLLTAIRESWPNRDPKGQCAVTALVVQDLLGGELLRSQIAGFGSHYWNKIPGMGEIDLTREQFEPEQFLPRGEVVTRRRVLTGERAETAKTRQRYRAMREALSKKSLQWP